VLGELGTDAFGTAAALVTGRAAATVVAEGSSPGVPAGVAVAGGFSEADGTLVGVDGVAEARSSAGVTRVTELVDPGASLHGIDRDGPPVVRVTARGSSPEEALTRAVTGLARTKVVVDMVPHLAGALDRVWF
jgi:hypothetical protein